MSLSHEGGSRLAIALSVAFQCVLSALFGIHSQTWPHVTLKINYLFRQFCELQENHAQPFSPSF